MWKVISIRRIIPGRRRIWMALLLLTAAFLCADRLWAAVSSADPEAVTALAQFDPLPQNVAVFDLHDAMDEKATERAASRPELLVEAVRMEEKETRRRVLIYHTHTYEAYRQDPEKPYQETETWRTKDNRCNVVRVGEELARLLTAKGYWVVHDTQAFEPPQLSSAYTRSLKMLEQRKKNGETYDLYIDLHRDAYTDSMADENTVKIGDQSLARLMVLVGRGSGESYRDKPDWEANLAAAEILTDDLNAQAEGLCRKIRIKSGRFNQHVGQCCLLIEAGNNENTLKEALASMPYLADSVDRLLACQE